MGVYVFGDSTVVNHGLIAGGAGAYGGYPLQPLGDAMKTLVALGRLNEMRKSINRIMRHLKLET